MNETTQPMDASAYVKRKSNELYEILIPEERYTFVYHDEKGHLVVRRVTIKSVKRGPFLPYRNGTFARPIYVSLVMLGEKKVKTVVYYHANSLPKLPLIYLRWDSTKLSGPFLHRFNLKSLVDVYQFVNDHPIFTDLEPQTKQAVN